MPKSESDVPTLRHMAFPVALVVGATPPLIGAMSKAALGAQVLVAECSVADAPTTAAQMRPLVMVMTHEVYEFDGEAFRALARDVRAKLLIIREAEPSAMDLETRLRAMLVDAEVDDPGRFGL